MHRRGQQYGDDSESLQADVMRFMAIIAFCLIAILALVKHAEPPEAETVSTAEPAPEAIPAATPEETDPEPEAPAPSVPAPEELQLAAVLPPQPEPDNVIEAAAPEPVLEQQAFVEPEPEPLPSQPDEPPARAPEPEAEPAIATEPAPDLPAAESPAEPEEQGLILRFASDGDFLRLIARGDIRVYAFQNTDVLTLSESYRFLDTSSPGQVYELLPPSIPAMIVDALRQARPDIDGYRWGIALPGHISNQIEQHLGRVRSGQLVIDRYGDVHHVAAS